MVAPAAAVTGIPEGYVLVPIILPPLTVSGIKDVLAVEHGIHSEQARPLWASLLSVVAGLPVEQQEALYAAERGCAPAPLPPSPAGAQADLIGFSAFDPDDRFFHAADRTWWKRGPDGRLVRAEPAGEVQP